MGVTILGGPRTEILTASVPKGLKHDIDAFARQADFSRSEAVAALIAAGFLILNLFLSDKDAPQAIKDESKSKRKALRVAKGLIEARRAIEKSN